jgi:hypothetical protein
MRATPGWRRFHGSFSSQRPSKIPKTYFSIFTAFPILGGWPLSALCLLGLSGAALPTLNQLGKILPALPSEQDLPPNPPAAQPIPIPQWRFTHLHIDLVGPLQNSSGCNHIFTIIDRASKWMDAILLSKTSTAACACALVFLG